MSAICVQNFDDSLALQFTLGIAFRCHDASVLKADHTMTHAQAIEAQFLLDMTAEEQKKFTPSELLLCKHALEYK